MKQIINMGLSLAFLGIAGWFVKDFLLVEDQSPLGGGVKTTVDQYQGQIDVIQESSR